MTESKSASLAPTKGKPGRKPGRTKPLVFATEGQRLLAARPEGSAELSRLVGCTPQRIDEWVTGRGRPSGPNAKLIEDTLGIPIASWARALGGAAPDPSEPNRIADPTRSAKERLEDLLADMVRRVPTSEAQRGKWVRDQRDLLKEIARIDKQEALTSDAIVRAHPEWKLIKATLINTLQPFPEALAALVTALARLDERKAATVEIQIDDDQEVVE